MIRLLIIADDFTGALDTGVQLVASGAATRVITDPSASLDTAGDGCEVLVVDAETRHLSAGQAYQMVYSIVKNAVRCHVPYIYKKTDSALRGNIGAELSALLDASGERQLSFLPAFPQMNRTTAGGVHYIDGVPVAQSVFGSDPFEPVLHSDIPTLISEQSRIPVQVCAPLGADSPLPESAGILAFDADSLDSMEATGYRLLADGKLHISAGCAGFGSVLPELLGLGSKPTPCPPLDSKMLVICGSVNPITLSQLDAAEKNGFTRLRLTPAQKLDEGHWESEQGQAEFDVIRRTVESTSLCIIDSNDAQGNQLTADYAAVQGKGIQEIRVGVSHSIGYVVSRLFNNSALGLLFITGGDTLLQCMNYMDVHEMEPVCELATGVVLSRFRYGSCTRYVLSKSGGFGGPELICQLAEQISHHS